MENNVVLSKQQIADFVNDALAMEIKIHSLHELASKLRAKASKINSDASYKWTQVEKKYRTEGGMSAQEFKIQSELNEVNTKIKKTLHLRVSFCFLYCFFLWCEAEKYAQKHKGKPY